jgi:hypothetical protein
MAPSESPLLRGRREGSRPSKLDQKYGVIELPKRELRPTQPYCAPHPFPQKEQQGIYQTRGVARTLETETLEDWM